MNSETQTLQAEYTSLLSAGDVDTLVERCYTSDARLHSFRFRASGSGKRLQPFWHVLAASGANWAAGNPASG